MDPNEFELLEEYAGYRLYERYLPRLQEGRRSSYQVWAESETRPSFTVAYFSGIGRPGERDPKDVMKGPALGETKRRIDDGDLEEGGCYERSVSL